MHLSGLYRATIGGMLLAGAVHPAFAAPFCMENQGLPPQCNYYDASECAQDAARQGGVCSANAKQFALHSGVGQFCVVTSTGASSCVYPDRGSCMAEAQRQHGACTAARTVAPARSPDPYAAVGGL